MKKVTIMQHIAKIEENLFLGSLFSAAPSSVEGNQITHIFHLGFEIPTPNLSTPYFKEHCQHEYFSLEDDPENTNRMITISEYIVPKIDELIKKGERVLVCCVAGKSRSASMIMLYLHHKYPNATYEELLQYVMSKREISINESFTNAIRNKINNK